jgi:TolB protein
MNLWEMDIRSHSLRQVTADSGTDLLPAISSTGRVGYTQYTHQVDLYWGPVDQPEEKHQRLTSHTQNNFGGRVALGGQRVAYHSNRTGNYEIWLLDRRTGAERNLTDHPAMDIMGDWSPDGREMVFLSNREGSLQVWVLDVESGGVRRVSEKSRPIPFEPATPSGSSPRDRKERRFGWWIRRARTSAPRSPASSDSTGTATAVTSSIREWPPTARE